MLLLLVVDVVALLVLAGQGLVVRIVRCVPPERHNLSEWLQQQVSE